MAKLIFIIVVITAIIVVFVSRAVAYSLARPLKITAVAQKVAEGDGSGSRGIKLRMR